MQAPTADDVMFNWQYATDRAGAIVSAGSYANLRMEKVDTHTVRVVFDHPSPFWPSQYASILLIAQHVFKTYVGARSREALANLKPVGTRAYVHVDFTPGDRLVAALNPNYHLALRPHFDRLELKGGGDSMSAARAVLQTVTTTTQEACWSKTNCWKAWKPRTRAFSVWCFCPPARSRRST